MGREGGRSTGTHAPRVALVGILALAGACGGGGDGSALAPPAALAYATPSAVYRLGVAIEDNVPSVTGAVERFTVAPPLPAGLALDERSGVVGGVPSALHARTEHVFRASNAAGSASASVVIAVEPPATRVAWAVGSGDGASAALLLDAELPRLVTAGTAPTALAAPLAAAAHPSGALLFVADPTAGTVAVQACDPRDGRPAPGAVALAGLARPAALVAPPRGDVLYVAESGAGAVATLAVGPDGELARRARTDAGSAPLALALAPGGKFLLAASASGELASLAIGADGGLAPARVATVGVTPVLLAAAETGAVDHALAAGAGGLTLLRIDPATGALAPRGPTLPCGTRPRGLAFDPRTAHVFVSDEARGEVLPFALDAGAGTLTAQPSLVLGGAPGALAVAEGLPFLVVADAVASEVRLVEIAPDATLTPGAVLRTRLAPRALVLGPNGAPLALAAEHAYVADASAARIHQFAVALAARAPELELVPLVPPFALSLAGPRALALHPDRALVLSADGPGLALESFARDPTRGVLAPLADEHEESVVSDVALEPSGRFAYSALASVGAVRAYALGARGAIAPLGDVPAGTRPERMELDPSGRTLYVTDQVADRLLAFAVELGGGALAPLADVATGVGPADVAVHPNGRFAFVPDALSATLSVFLLEPLAGAPLLLATIPTLDPLPVRAALHPDGRSLYLLHEGVNQLAHWTVDPDTGRVERRASIETFSTPLALAVDPGGAFLLVTNALGQSLHFALGPHGAPRLAGTGVAGASPRGLLLPPSLR